MHRRNILLNSTALFVVATILQTTLHELGHFVTAIILQAREVTLFHNYVQHDTDALPLYHRLLIAAAGPLFSLLIGILFHFCCAGYKQRNLRFLFFLYLSVFGYINFFGYLMVSPLFVSGDTGYIFSQLNFPLWLTIGIALSGVVGLFFVLKTLGRYFVEMGPPALLEDLPLRRPFLQSLVEYPLYIGIVLTTLLNLPAPVFLSLLYPLCSPFGLMWVYGYMLKGKFAAEAVQRQPEQLNRLQPGLIAALVLVVALNRVLVFGFSV